MNAIAWVQTAYRTGMRPVRSTVMPFLFLAALVLGARQTVAQTRELRVAAAADMQPVMDVLVPPFEKKTGMKLKVSYGSSATLSEQIIAGAPMDIFFSADFYFAEKIVAANLTEVRTPEPYARGLLVLWAPKSSRFNPLNVDVLQRKDLKSVAIANPDHAPYGRAAVAAMKKVNVYENVAPHLVQAESVAQAAQFALSGNAELALVSETIAMSAQYRDRGNFALFPLTVYPEIRQTAVILRASKRRQEAHEFLNYMLSDAVQDQLPKLGLRSFR